jgi:purine nucleosidase
MTDKTPIILDTDIGSDIDDAICLSYLLNQPRCELVGITTVSGQPQNRAALADAVCQGAGYKDVPIFSGIDKALLGSVVQADCHQALALPKLAHRSPDSFKPYQAVPWLRETIRARPGEITLLGIGMMMNIGTLFAIDPEIPGMLKSLVLMCGCFFDPRPYPHEWNARLDPISTALVYNAPVKDHASVGLDVTFQCKMPSNQATERFAQTGGALGVVATMLGAKPREPWDMVFHDPLTGVAIFEPVCEWEAGNVTVELDSRSVAGMTHFEKLNGKTPGAVARHRAARKVDSVKFFERYFSVFDSKGAPRKDAALAV